MYFMPHQNIKPTAIALVDAFPVSTGKDAAQKYSVDRIRGALKSRKKPGLNFVFGRRFRPQELVDTRYTTCCSAATGKPRPPSITQAPSAKPSKPTQC